MVTTRVLQGFGGFGGCSVRRRSSSFGGLGVQGSGVGGLRVQGFGFVGFLGVLQGSLYGVVSKQASRCCCYRGVGLVSCLELPLNPNLKPCT